MSRYKTWKEAVYSFFFGDEIDHLYNALCDARASGKIKTKDLQSYLRHALECKEQGIERKDWFQFFKRDTWK